MTFNELLKKYEGRRVYGYDTGVVPVKNTAYGAIIEGFELDKYDIQLTCLDSQQLEELLKKLTADVHD